MGRIEELTFAHQTEQMRHKIDQRGRWEPDIARWPSIIRKFTSRPGQLTDAL